jgi:predicted small secreted protein
MKSLVKPLFALALVALTLALPACNTTKGMGKDMEKAGEGIQNSAEKHGAN